VTLSQVLKRLLKKSSENVILFPIRGNFESERFSKKKRKEDLRFLCPLSDSRLKY
jgi:hypothetical protein